MIDDLEGDDAARTSRILPHLAALDREGFDLVVDWTIAALETQWTQLRRRADKE